MSLIRCDDSPVLNVGFHGFDVYLFALDLEENLEQELVADALHQPGVGSLSPFNAGVALLPGAVDALTKRGESKVFIGLSAYDDEGQHVATRQSFMSKAARDDWEVLNIVYQVEKDGFIEVSANKGGSDSFVFETFGNENWLKVGKQSGSATSPPGKVGDGSQPTRGFEPIPGGASESSCTAWYWCTQYGCEFLYITCSYDDGGYGPNPGGDDGTGGVDNRPGCAECKAKAQREHDTRLNHAKLILSTAVFAGCHAAGFGTFVAFNAAGWWVNFIPGIGTAAIEALSVLGGLTVDISCLVERVSSFTAEKATIENSYYKDMRNCEQLFTDCN